MDVSANRNDSEQNVDDDELISVTGTNISSPNTTMSFAGNQVTITEQGLYMITASLTIDDNVDNYLMAINVGGTDYLFYVDVETGNTNGVASHTIHLNITTNPTEIGLYNRNGGDVTFTSAELNVTKLI